MATTISTLAAVITCPAYPFFSPPLQHVLGGRVALHGVSHQAASGRLGSWAWRGSHAQPQGPPLLVYAAAQELSLAQGEIA